MHQVVIDPAWVLDAQRMDRDEVISALVSLMAPRMGDIPPGRAVQAVLQRERLCPTVVSEHLAIPHARLQGLPAFLVGLARVAQGVEFAPQKRVRLVCLLLGPEGSQEQYLNVLASLLRLFQHREGKLLRVSREKAARILAEGLAP